MSTENAEKQWAENEIARGPQENAVTRAILLLGSGGQLRLEDVFNRLAEAEQKAGFVCGFIMLNQNSGYKEMLGEHLIGKGLISVDGNGFVALTPEGNKRANAELPPGTELPPEIERELKRL